MERLRYVCHTEDRKVLVSIDRLDLCKVGERAIVSIRGNGAMWPQRQYLHRGNATMCHANPVLSGRLGTAVPFPRNLPIWLSMPFQGSCTNFAFSVTGNSPEAACFGQPSGEVP